MKLIFSSVVAGLLLVLLSFEVVQGKYNLVANFSGDSFFDNFNFDTYDDPTHGYVDYVNEADARKWGFISTSGNAPVYVGADHSSVSSGRGRGSVRLTSKKSFNYGLFVIDLIHMPTGCGTWPAWWTVGPNWPNSGEIDIIEGVNTQNFDQTTLHTNPGCDMGSEDRSKFTGNMVESNCAAAGNAGCGIQTGQGTYGQSFNDHQGGVFVMEWTTSYIQAFYFPRSGIPGDIANGNPNPAGWGKPYAYFQLGGNCPTSHFANHQLVLDLTFCGDWAGAVFGSQCPGKGDCATYVKNNPNDFADAYWIINYVKVFLNQ